MCGVLLLQTAAGASAAGVNLSWNNCGAAGSVEKHFACNTNTGPPPAVFVASVRAPAGISRWASFETFVDVQSSGATLPAWWQLRNEVGQIDQCRNGFMSVSSDFTGAPYAGACADPYQNQGSGGLSSYRVGFGGANRARMRVVFSVPPAYLHPLDEGVEYFTMRASINYGKTVGTGSCAGCAEEVLLVCDHVLCIQPNGTPGGNVTVMNPAERNYVVWNQSATPTRSATWGSIKALYR
jgi:hypothetical protein